MSMYNYNMIDKCESLSLLLELYSIYFLFIHDAWNRDLVTSYFLNMIIDVLWHALDFTKPMIKIVMVSAKWEKLLHMRLLICRGASSQGRIGCAFTGPKMICLGCNKISNVKTYDTDDLVAVFVQIMAWRRTYDEPIS